jgi:dTDP-4-amino-4,6-dideoxygalactose transaminase
MQVPFLDLKVQYQSLKSEIDPAIQQVCADAAFVLGKNVFEFEKAYADYCQTGDAIAVNSGTTALHLALLSLGIGVGDEVITAANTFIATCEAISYTGARVVLVDCDEITYTLDPNKLEAAITKRTKAIIPVHLYGQPADLDAIVEIADRHGVPIIEDAAQAHGAEYKGKRCGSIGRLGCFSFYPGKNLGAYGEGGAITTSDRELATVIRRLRDHGSDQKYYHEVVGYNYRMEGIQGAVLGVKLKHLDDWNKARRANADLYRKHLEGADVIVPREGDGRKHIYHLFVIRHQRRDELIEFLKEKGIGALIHYPIPIHLQKAYQHLALNEGAFPVTEMVSKEILSLPMFPELTEEQIRYTSERIKAFS